MQIELIEKRKKGLASELPREIKQKDEKLKQKRE